MRHKFKLILSFSTIFYIVLVLLVLPIFGKADSNNELPHRQDLNLRLGHDLVSKDINLDTYDDILIPTNSGLYIEYGNQTGLTQAQLVWDDFQDNITSILWITNVSGTNSGLILTSLETDGKGFIYYAIHTGAILMKPIIIGQVPREISGMVAMDFENDGDKDLFIGLRNSADLYLLNYTTAFQAPNVILHMNYSFPVSMCSTDINNDTYEEIIFGTGEYDNGIILWNQNGTGFKQERFFYVNNLKASFVSSIVIGDFNADNHLDIAIGYYLQGIDYTYGELRIYFCNGTDWTHYRNAGWDVSGRFPTDMQVFDVDNDNKDDLIYGLSTRWYNKNSYQKYPVVVLHQDPNTNYIVNGTENLDGTKVTNIIGFDNDYAEFSDLFIFGQSEILDSANLLAIGDWNGNGFQDLAFATPNLGLLFSYFGQENNKFNDPYTSAITAEKGFLSQAALKIVICYLVALLIDWFIANGKNSIEDAQIKIVMETGIALLIYGIVIGLRYLLLVFPRSIQLSIYSFAIFGNTIGSMLGDFMLNYLLAIVLGFIGAIIFAGGKGRMICMGIIMAVTLSAILQLPDSPYFYQFKFYHDVFLLALIEAILFVIFNTIGDKLTKSDESEARGRLTIKVLIGLALLYIIPSVFDNWISSVLL